jgi:glycogen synthase
MLGRIFVAILLALLGLPFLASAESEPNILFVSAEHGRFYQTGGLAHAVYGLASSLNEEGASKADIAMPFYLNMNTPPELIYLTQQHLQVPLDYHGGQPSRTAEFLVAKDKAANGGETLFFRHLPNSGQQNYFDNVNINGKKTYGPEASINLKGLKCKDLFSK